jgi:type IV pilus assembly protein PilN
MARINLLPWRDERREELKKEFLLVLGVVAVAALLLLFLANRVINSQIEGQESRNAYLKQNISTLERQVTEISDLEERKAALLDRMKIIQELQGNRPVIVRVFDELVRTIPDGVFYTTLERKGNSVDVGGTAESNNRVSSLMRQLDKSDWFAEPNLTGVTANPNFGEQGNDFQLTVKINKPVESAEEAADGAK